MPEFDIDEAAIRHLAELMAQSGLAEIELAEGERRLRVVRAATGEARALAPEDGAAARRGSPAPAAPEAPATDPDKQAPAVTAPMVGTAYTRPEPGAAPFVQPGESVAPGQTVMIVEAMKVMNPVRAGRGGTVAAILVEDGQPVEYGEPLIELG